jgi:hypothetical protein
MVFSVILRALCGKGFAFPMTRDVGDFGDLFAPTRLFSTFVASKALS